MSLTGLPFPQCEPWMSQLHIQGRVDGCWRQEGGGGGLPRLEAES